MRYLLVGLLIAAVAVILFRRQLVELAYETKLLGYE